PQPGPLVLPTGSRSRDLVLGSGSSSSDESTGSVPHATGSVVDAVDPSEAEIDDLVIRIIRGMNEGMKEFAEAAIARDLREEVETLGRHNRLGALVHEMRSLESDILELRTRSARFMTNLMQGGFSDSEIESEMRDIQQRNARLESRRAERSPDEWEA